MGLGQAVSENISCEAIKKNFGLGKIPREGRGGRQCTLSPQPAEVASVAATVGNTSHYAKSKETMAITKK